MSDDFQSEFTDLGELATYVANSTLMPPERLTVAEAAEKYRYLNNAGSFVGQWSNAETPYLVEPMEVLTARDKEAAVLVAPAQSGKTSVIENFWLYSEVCDPSDFIVYQTAQDTARDFSHRRIDRMHRDSPELGKRLRAGANNDNTYDKFYSSGAIGSLSWPSINQLSGKSIPRVCLTDLDRMPLDVDGEGSPFDLGRKRTTTFGSFAMTFAESSPGHLPTEPQWMARGDFPHEAPPCPGILSLYNRGDRRRWYWPCPECGEYFEGSFSLLIFNPDDEDISKAAADVVMRCPANGCAIEPKHKHAMNQFGVWLKEGEKIDRDRNITGTGVRSKIASFWLKGTAARFVTWQTLVERYLLAVREFERNADATALKATVNTDQGEPYFPYTPGSVRTPEALKNAAIEIPKDEERKVPEGVRFLIATIDVQKGKFISQVFGISPDSEMDLFDIHLIDRFDIRKSNRHDEDGERYPLAPAAYQEDWDLITEQIIEKEYELVDGSGFMSIKLVLCDSGGRAGVTTKAYQYWRQLKAEGKANRFQLVKGSNNLGAPLQVLTYPDSDRKDRTAGARGEIPVLMLNVNALKDQLDGMLERNMLELSDIKPEVESHKSRGGRLYIPKYMPNDVFVELTVESKDKKGRWINPASKRNEAWDLGTYCLGGLAYMRVHRFDWNRAPDWAAEWNKNTLVRAREADRPFAQKSSPDYGFAKFGASLG